ncbi:hypothetical protein GCM10010236_80710 [Streptomyces eurythermus]|nr:hypothetical protein GCM10010236_80710 [Streptomyces eurythermus]
MHAQRFFAALREIGHAIDEKRARQLLRDLAADGTIQRVDADRAAYPPAMAGAESAATAAARIRSWVTGTDRAQRGRTARSNGARAGGGRARSSGSERPGPADQGGRRYDDWAASRDGDLGDRRLASGGRRPGADSTARGGPAPRDRSRDGVCRGLWTSHGGASESRRRAGQPWTVGGLRGDERQYLPERADWG